MVCLLLSNQGRCADAPRGAAAILPVALPLALGVSLLHRQRAEQQSPVSIGQLVCRHDTFNTLASPLSIAAGGRVGQDARAAVDDAELPTGSLGPQEERLMGQKHGWRRKRCMTARSRRDIKQWRASRAFWSSNETKNAGKQSLDRQAQEVWDGS